MTMHREDRRMMATSPVRKTRQTKVRFGRDECRWFVKDLTKEEKTKVWYKKEDYIRIHANNHAQIRGAISGCNRKSCAEHHAPPQYQQQQQHHHKEETLNVRGLEHHFPGRNNEKRHRRREHAHYLLHAHKYLQVTNPHELREYAVSLSDYDQRRAQRIAAYDAFEAFRVHRESNVPYMQMDEYSEFNNVPKPTNLSTATGTRQRSIAAQLA